jgi:hypothetical protein
MAYLHNGGGRVGEKFAVSGPWKTAVGSPARVRPEVRLKAARAGTVVKRDFKDTRRTSFLRRRRPWPGGRRPVPGIQTPNTFHTLSIHFP